MATKNNLDSHILELRRGAIVIAVLSCLKEKQYGYSMRQQVSKAGLDVSEGTLYPLLRRLEKQGYLTSEWLVTDNRPRRYYMITTPGTEALKALTQELRSLVRAIENLII